MALERPPRGGALVVLHQQPRAQQMQHAEPPRVERVERREHGAAEEEQSVRSPAAPARSGAWRLVALLEVELRGRGAEAWHHPGARSLSHNSQKRCVEDHRA